ncbi:hypothetical protein AK812_SmicGene47980, partial [Symbiodinium microadriaticum]
MHFRTAACQELSRLQANSTSAGIQREVIRERKRQSQEHHPLLFGPAGRVREVSALRIPKKTRLGDTKAFAFTVATNPFDDVVRKELDQMGTMEAAVWSENEVLLLAAEGEQRARASGARRLQHPVFLSAVVVVHVGVHAPRVQL